MGGGAPIKKHRHPDHTQQQPLCWHGIRTRWLLTKGPRACEHLTRRRCGAARELKRRGNAEGVSCGGSRALWRPLALIKGAQPTKHLRFHRAASLPTCAAGVDSDHSGRRRPCHRRLSDRRAQLSVQCPRIIGTPVAAAAHKQRLLGSDPPVGVVRAQVERCTERRGRKAGAGGRTRLAGCGSRRCSRAPSRQGGVVALWGRKVASSAPTKE